MSRELQATRMIAINKAYLCSCNVPAHISAKGIDFGDIVAHGDGTVDTSNVQGVSDDLVIRPFHQNGAAVSIRQFTNEGMNQHLGLQSQELFGIDTDPDGDGVKNELTVGDITAISLFQAQLGTPGRVIPDDPVRRQAVRPAKACSKRSAARTATSRRCRSKTGCLPKRIRSTPNGSFSSR